MAQPDPFDSLLTLEDTLYTTAYTLGQSDGSRAGRIEGRIFGLEKGFDKFAALGTLHGRSVLWASRLPQQKLTPPQQTPQQNPKSDSNEEEQRKGKKLPLLAANPRLQSNVTLLHSLTDPETFSTDNTEDAVANFDDRFKRAGAKVKVIERIVGEGEAHALSSTTSSSKAPAGRGGGEQGRAGKGATVRRGVGEGSAGKTKGVGDGNMEDFAGSRLVR
ncbi:Nn.00g062490.m01.CDS01 [Neocucurbitaria sp. VM-36]